MSAVSQSGNRRLRQTELIPYLGISQSGIGNLLQKNLNVHKSKCNTLSYHCQYANVFDSFNTYTYIYDMKTLREVLIFLMDKAGDDAYSLERKSGVPQPTTHRFLKGKHGDPRSTTVKKWADAYGVTESQLRGDMPLDNDPSEVAAKEFLDENSKPSPAVDNGTDSPVMFSRQGPRTADNRDYEKILKDLLEGPQTNRRKLISLIAGIEERAVDAMLKMVSLFKSSSDNENATRKAVDPEAAQQIELKSSPDHAKGKDSAFRTFKAPELLKVPGTSRGDGKKTPKEGKK